MRIIVIALLSLLTVLLHTQIHWKPPGPDLVIMVISARENFENRDLMRKYMMNSSSDMSMIVTKFILGNRPCLVKGSRYECKGIPSAITPEMQRKNNLEKEQYGDIVEVDMVDFYRALPKKLKLAYKWGVETYPTAKWFAKIDDDVFFNARNIYKSLTEYDFPVVLGAVRREMAVARTGKWAESFYPKKKYPDSPTGSGYLANRLFAQFVATHADDLHEYQGEDVSVGIWIDEKIPNSKIIHSEYVRSISQCERDSWTCGHELGEGDMLVLSEYLKPVEPIKTNYHLFMLWESQDGTMPELYKRALKSILKVYGTERVIIASRTLVKSESWYPRIWRDYENDLFTDPTLVMRIKQNKKYRGPHTADLFRLMVLYKYGGIYTDADALWVNPVELGNGFLTMVDDKVVSNGCIGMPAGHPYLKRVIDSLEYDPGCWNCLGSVVLSKIRNDCKGMCDDFKLIDYINMYTIPWDKSERAMETPGSKDDLQKLVNGTNYQLHIYGKLNGRKRSFKPGTIHDLVATYINV